MRSILISHAEPEVSLLMPHGFAYVGRKEIPLKGVAIAERYHFVEADGPNVARLFITQFERFLEGVGSRYAFEIPSLLAGSNYRFSPQRIELAGFEFVHNTWAFDVRQDAAQNPTAESAASLDLLRSADLRLAAELIMSRFVTEIGPEQRAELILFYLEPLVDHGLSLSQLGEDEQPRPDYDAASELVTRRSLEMLGGLSRELELKLSTAQADATIQAVVRERASPR